MNLIPQLNFELMKFIIQSESVTDCNGIFRDILRTNDTNNRTPEDRVNDVFDSLLPLALRGLLYVNYHLKKRNMFCYLRRREKQWQSSSRTAYAVISAVDCWKSRIC